MTKSHDRWYLVEDESVMEPLTRGWDGTPREQALAWELNKDRRRVRCAPWSHPFGWELRATLDGELLRTQAYRDAELVLRDFDNWRAQFINKGWRPLAEKA